MAALQKLATVLLLWNAFVISGWAQGQLIMNNNSAARIWLDRNADGTTNGPTDALLPAGQVAIYAAAGVNQPEGALILQPGAKTNLFAPGLFAGGTRTLSLSNGPATVQVRVWTGAFPSYEAAQSAALGGNPGAITGRSIPLNITLTLSPNPAPPLTANGFQGVLLGGPAWHSSYVRWGNTSETGIYTNDCSGPIAAISGAGAFRFGLYVGPLGAPAHALVLAALTTNSAAPGIFGSPDPIALPMQFQPGGALTFQVRGWPLSAGTTFEQAITNPVPGLVGVSALGYFTPGYDIFSAPSLLGTGPGQVSGFELKGLCPSRMTPGGPLKFIGMGRDNTITWNNIANTTPGASATYRLSAASDVTGPYTNWSTVTANTALVTFNNSFSEPSLFFKLEWIDAPLPQPAGLWDYQAFDVGGALMAAGNFTCTTNFPGAFTRSFIRVQNSEPANVHPSGVGAGQAQSIGSSNLIEMVLSSEFRLRGQMVGDYYAGDWFAEAPTSVTHTGRFVARRRF